MRRSFLIFPVLAALAAGLRAQTADSCFQPIPYEAAVEKATAENKPLFLFYEGHWSGDSRRLARETFADPRVAAFLREHTVALRIDVLKSPDLTKIHGIQTVPSLRLQRPDSLALHRSTAYLSPGALLKELECFFCPGPVREYRARSKPDDIDGRYALTLKLLTTGAYDEALPEFIRLYDKAPISKPLRKPRVDEARFEHVLSRLVELGEVYPPAKLALEQRIARAEQKMLQNPQWTLTVRRYVRTLATIGQVERLGRIRGQLPEGSKVRKFLDANYAPHTKAPAAGPASAGEPASVGEPADPVANEAPGS